MRANSLTAARKLLRFMAIYGPGRSLIKAAGRLRVDLPDLAWRRSARDIGVIGCGQFAYATIAYFLQRAFGRRIATCYDIDPRASQTFGRAMRVPTVCTSVEQLLAHPQLRLVYIASNHASHSPYAVAALRRGFDVYLEKPVAVTRPQLIALLQALRDSGRRLFAGYNRPFSAAVRELRRQVRIDSAAGITLQCFVSGHQLGPDHWYRQPQEGTRVCGNVGHWLDLMVHVLSWRGLPDRVEISLTWASEAEPDDNVNIAISTDRGDVFAVLLTSRCEPFEGINETINFQHGETIVKIDDFRRMTLWQGARLQHWRFWPKDVGHRRAILQPFSQEPGRDWQEVVLSTLLMLHITDMVRARARTGTFSFAQGLASVSQELARQ